MCQLDNEWQGVLQGIVIRVTEENKDPNLLAFCPFFGVAQKVT